MDLSFDKENNKNDKHQPICREGKPKIGYTYLVVQFFLEDGFLEMKYSNKRINNLKRLPFEYKSLLGHRKTFIRPKMIQIGASNEKRRKIERTLIIIKS